MSELFETYEREFCDLSGAITCDLNDLQTGAARSKAGALEAKFATLQESLRNMEVELASLPAAKKARAGRRALPWSLGCAVLFFPFTSSIPWVGRIADEVSYGTK